jgi:hypothetical protein
MILGERAMLLVYSSWKRQEKPAFFEALSAKTSDEVLAAFLSFSFAPG